MGSSKKHKEKDKDRERRHKHKDRDKDKDRDRKHRSKHRHRDRDRHAEKEIEAGEVSSPEKEKSERKRRRSRSPSPPNIKLEKDLGYPDGQKDDVGGSGAGGGGFSESLSIAETNKIRAKLGLAPLEVDDGEEGGEPGEIMEEKKDVHKPAVNISEVKKSEALREKMALIREKRLINKKLHKVKTLADDDDDDDAAAWIEKMRKKQIARNEAEKRAKMLEEMDQEFGIGKIVEDEFSRTKQQDAYSATHLGGLKVEHSLKKFREGQSVILTLKDMDALKEDEDEMLVNVNLMDDERAAKNVENKKKRPDYKAYQEDEFDEDGMFRHRTLLSKYDEEIEGEKKQSFTLNAGGGASFDDEDHMDRIRNQLRQQATSLEMKAPTLASEYYTPTEMEAFKKPKKRRRKLKAKSIADELAPVADTGRDHGARGGFRRRVREEEVEAQVSSSRNGMTSTQQDLVDMEVDFPDADQAPIEFGRARNHDDDDIWGQVIEDEAEKELHNVLNKARKLKQKSKAAERVEDQVAKVVANIKQEPEMEEEEEEEEEASTSRSTNLIFNSTSEFCRTLGDIPSYGKSGLRDEEEEALDFEKEEQEEEMEDENEDEAGGAWNAVSLEDRVEAQKQEEDVRPILDDEPLLHGGVAGALSLATKKGYLVKEVTKKDKNMTTITAKNFTVEDKNFNDIDAKYSKNDNRYRGPLTDFKEKSDYKPDVKISYTDDTGRQLNQKEAFRVLSHRFHGKGSGKMKTEKRAKKLLEEEAMKKMSSTDTPLNTVARMQEKQKTLQSAYIVLSGGSKTMTAHSITK